jgi:hypothetical protein
MFKDGETAWYPCRRSSAHQAHLDAQKELNLPVVEPFRARLTLLLANRVGDDGVVPAAIAAAVPEPR